MYDYEAYPQEVSFFVSLISHMDHCTPTQLPFTGTTFYEIGRKYLTIGDGILIASSTAYDGEAMDAVKEWFGSVGKVVYPVGPLSLPQSENGSLSKNGKSDSQSRPVVEFLDRMQRRYGERSVIYVRSFFCPSVVALHSH
jgi:hypothetical protein